MGNIVVFPDSVGRAYFSGDDQEHADQGKQDLLKPSGVCVPERLSSLERTSDTFDHLIRS